MSAFGKRGGISGGARPNFGVAKPMKGSAGGSAESASFDEGGEQFPPIEELAPAMESLEPNGGVPQGAAMDRLTARQNASGEAGSSKAEGFEASVHRI
jgi:pilus assembly protein CpaF